MNNKSNKLKAAGLGALVISTAALLNSGCETCIGIHRLPQAQGCYQQSPCATGYYQQSPCYQPEVSVCGPAGCGTGAIAK
ncbi:hypothetical protein J4429_04815 [Candidatus Pacearchaeota archaeon]|nr:hypothetical protein [Candidatus Pacearchaeota archaeon]